MDARVELDGVVPEQRIVVDAAGNGVANHVVGSGYGKHFDLAGDALGAATRDAASAASLFARMIVSRLTTAQARRRPSVPGRAASSFAQRLDTVPLRVTVRS